MEGPSHRVTTTYSDAETPSTRAAFRIQYRQASSPRRLGDCSALSVSEICLVVIRGGFANRPDSAQLQSLSFSAILLGLNPESADLKTESKVASRDHSNRNGTSANMSTALPLGKPLTSVSIVLPVINETFSLSRTVDILETENGDVIKEYIIVVSPRKTIPASIEVCNELRERLPTKVIVLPQQRPFLGGACMDAFDAATGSHIIMMGSDLETDPHQVKQMIALARENPDCIVLNSRWIENGKFIGYDQTKLFMNYFFQKFFAVLFNFASTDFTYAFRIYPTALVQAIRWEELKHPFLLESLIKPLRLKVKTIEIPAVWRPRQEGESQNTLLGNFPYLAVGIRVRFMSRTSILKELG
jgi:hypothetical protein